MFKSIRSLHFEWDLVAALGCACIAILGIRITNDAALWNYWMERGSYRVEIGTLQKVTGDVRFRTSGSLAWRELWIAEQAVDSGDRVFTGPNGTARIKFHDGSSVEIAPDSLVVIQLAGDAPGRSKWLKGFFQPLLTSRSITPSLDVQQGSVKLEMQPTTDPFQVSVQGKRYLLNSKKGSGTVEVYVDPKNLQQPAAFKTEGKLRLEIQDLSQERVRSTKVREGQVALLNSEGKLKRDEAAKVSRPTRPLAELAQEVHPAKSPWLNINPARESIRGSTSSGLNTPFEVKAISADTALGNGKSLDQITVPLTWTSVPGAEKYVVTVTDKSGGTVVTENVSSNKFDFKLKNLDSLAYSYRVQSKSRDGSTQDSREAPIQIQLIAPKPKSPAENTILPPEKKILLAWERLALVAEFEVQVSKNARFEPLFSESRNKSNLYGFQPDRPGIYYWRVRALVPGGKSDWSRTNSFTVK